MKSEEKKGRIYIDLKYNSLNKIDYQLEISNLKENPTGVFDAMAFLILENETLYRIIRGAMIKVNEHQDNLAIEWEKKRRLERRKDRAKN